MKTRTLLALTLITAPLGLLAQQNHPDAKAPAKEAEPPVPMVEAGPRPQPAAVEQAGQKLYGTADTLISSEKAKEIVTAFRSTVAKDKPRYLIYVNRELVDETSGFRVTGRRERTESVQGETKSAFEADPNAPKPSAPADCSNIGRSWGIQLM